MMKKPEYVVREIFDNEEIKYGVYYNIEPDRVQLRRNVPNIEYHNLVIMCINRNNADIICAALNNDCEIEEQRYYDR